MLCPFTVLAINYTRIYYFLNIVYTKIYLVSLICIINSFRVKIPCLAHLLPQSIAKSQLVRELQFWAEEFSFHPEDPWKPLMVLELVTDFTKAVIKNMIQ